MASEQRQNVNVPEAAAPVATEQHPQNSAVAKEPEELNPDGTPLSDKQRRKRAEKAEKERIKAEKAARLAAEQAARQAQEVDFAEGNYGVLPMNQSQ